MFISTPRDTFVLYNLGMCYSELGDYKESINTLEKCVAIDPKNSNALVALGFSYFNEGLMEKAKEVLLKALELQPDNIYALLNLGGVYASTKDYVSAVNTFKKAERIDPENPKILYGLALAYKNVEEFYKASQYFKKIVNLGKDDKIVELSKDHLREIAEAEFKNMQLRELTEILAEIALKGERGFDVHDPEQKYELASLPGKYSGLNLVCYLYVGFQIIDPTKDIGFDLSKEYEAAKEILENEQNE
jgi:tetratricopeptide (TPR) repeat protein